MNKYIVDIGSFLYGRTIEISAGSTTDAYNLACEQLNRNKFEKVIQIRNSNGMILYTYWNDSNLSIYK